MLSILFPCVSGGFHPTGKPVCFSPQIYNLRKVQARLDKISKRSKQFQIDFRREQNSHGRFHTRAYIERGEKEYITPDLHLIYCKIFHPNHLFYYFTSHEPFFLDPILSIAPSSSNSFISICTVLLNLSIISDSSTCVNDGFSLRSSNIYSRSVIWLFCTLFCALFCALTNSLCV